MHFARVTIYNPLVAIIPLNKVVLVFKKASFPNCPDCVWARLPSGVGLERLHTKLNPPPTWKIHPVVSVTDLEQHRPGGFERNLPDVTAAEPIMLGEQRTQPSCRTCGGRHRGRCWYHHEPVPVVSILYFEAGQKSAVPGQRGTGKPRRTRALARDGRVRIDPYRPRRDTQDAKLKSAVHAFIHCLEPERVAV